MKTLLRLSHACWVTAYVGAVTAVTVTFASTSGSSASSSSPSTSAYIEQPQSSTTTVVSSGGGYYYGGSPWGSSSYWGGSSYYGDHTYYTQQPRRYFFPPAPPALGEPYLKNYTKSASTTRSSIPLGLSDYINEPFYSPLSPFLYDEDLSRKRQKTIDDYRAAKQGLVSELQAKINALRSADEPTRSANLAEFAREQTPRIIPVEKMAYDIRDDLTGWHFFGGSSDWNEGRQWRLGDDTRWESTMDEAKVMRGAAYFQAGLSPAQRRLLREYAMELDDSGRGPTADITLQGRSPLFYFSPETARIRLPGNLSPELRAKIASYSDLKSALKRELRDTLYREDRSWLDSSRTNALRTLAQKQEPQFAAVEALAEEIRQDLAKFPNPARPQAITSTLPKPLTDRVNSFVERRSEYQRAMNARLADLKAKFGSSRVEFVKMGQGFGIQVVPNRRLNADQESRIQAAISQLSSFNDEQIKIYVALIQDKEEIRAGLTQAAGNLSSMMTARIIDLMLSEYTAALARQDLWLQYRDYDAAVLQPGLSPEQRRILFDAALVSMDLQLRSYTY